MSRNSSGTYSLPAGQPVVSGTTIDASVFNTLIADLAAEMTDSLDRSGKGAMLAALQLVDGTAGAPALSFATDTDTGIYRIGANDFAVVANGAVVLEFTTTGAAVTGALTVSTTLAVTSTATTAQLTATGGAGASGLIGKAGSGGTKPGVIGLGTSATAQALSQSPGVYGRGAASSSSVYADAPTNGGTASIFADGDGAPGLQLQISNNNSLGVAAHMNLVPVTAAPTLHNDGDIWIENISGAWALKVRLNGATKTVTVS